MKRLFPALLLGMAACSAAGDPRIARRDHPPRLMKAGILPGQSIPAERDGISASETGAIMFVCANSDQHADEEVFIEKCPSCPEKNYFYWDRDGEGFRCFACGTHVDGEVVKCPKCGKVPPRVRTKPKANK
jgi:hypothetical protein